MSIEPDDVPQPQLWTMQIICAALMMGVFIPLAIFLFLVLVQQQKPILTKPEDMQMLSLVAIVLLAANASLSLFLPVMMTKSALPRLATSEPSVLQLIALYQTTLIIGLALLEGAAMLGCVAFFLEAHVVDLAVVGIGLILMAARFPTRGRVATWLAQQRAALEDYPH
jgi:hypothetical protein